ncbi:hypothetical protein OG21DRAFT_1521077 [Imleria badia]|nr:hypothetical protein OG21DRAFT_1521077 [Imleria badia]
MALHRSAGRPRHVPDYPGSIAPSIADTPLGSTDTFEVMVEGRDAGSSRERRGKIKNPKALDHRVERAGAARRTKNGREPVRAAISCGQRCPVPFRPRSRTALRAKEERGRYKFNVGLMVKLGRGTHVNGAMGALSLAGRAAYRIESVRWRAAVKGTTTRDGDASCAMKKEKRSIAKMFPVGVTVNMVNMARLVDTVESGGVISVERGEPSGWEKFNGPTRKATRQTRVGSGQLNLASLIRVGLVTKPSIDKSGDSVFAFELQQAIVDESRSRAPKWQCKGLAQSHAVFAAIFKLPHSQTKSYIYTDGDSLLINKNTRTQDASFRWAIFLDAFNSNYTISIRHWNRSSAPEKAFGDKSLIQILKFQVYPHRPHLVPLAAI